MVSQHRNTKMEAAVIYKLTFKSGTNVTHNFNHQKAHDWFVLCHASCDWPTDAACKPRQPTNWTTVKLCQGGISMRSYLNGRYSSTLQYFDVNVILFDLYIKRLCGNIVC